MTSYPVMSGIIINHYKNPYYPTKQPVLGKVSVFLLLQVSDFSNLLTGEPFSIHFSWLLWLVLMFIVLLHQLQNAPNKTVDSVLCNDWGVSFPSPLGARSIQWGMEILNDCRWGMSPGKFWGRKKQGQLRLRRIITELIRGNMYSMDFDLGRWLWLLLYCLVIVFMIFLCPFEG